MDMPWYGYLLSSLAIWVTGFIAGRGAGASQALMMQAQLQAKAMQMPGLPPGMPGPGGR